MVKTFKHLYPQVYALENLYLAWQPTLLDEGAVVRVWGRKGGRQRHLSPQPFGSLEEAWPLIRSIVRVRLRHGYRIVEG